jgi:hypothetical protein
MGRSSPPRAACILPALGRFVKITAPANARHDERP